MNIDDQQSNSVILKNLGRKLERMRIDARIPDLEVIRRGGIKKDAWYSLKSGGNVTITNFVRALKGLDRLDLLDGILEYESPASPLNPVHDKTPAPRKRIRIRKTEAGA